MITTNCVVVCCCWHLKFKKFMSPKRNIFGWIPSGYKVKEPELFGCVWISQISTSGVMGSVSNIDHRNNYIIKQPSKDNFKE